MLRLTLLAAALLFTAVADAEGPTSIELDGKTYGASPDEIGPIGGGSGYTKIVTKGDYTVSTLEQLLDALGKAKPGQVVFIPGETEIDCTTRLFIEGLVLEIPAGVTLAGNRGQEGSQGGAITSDALKTSRLIQITGPDVRITGLRLLGPNPKRYLDHHKRSFSGGAGHSYYYKFPTQNGIHTAQPGLEVDNCEISAFGHAGICLSRGEGHRIHHNFIHHCQYNGLGYGISHDVSSSIIERNLFDSNRHSIAGTGRPGCGYEARHNVELGTSLSHCFDMHGGRDRKDGTDIAGDSILVHNNTFRASTQPVVIRGTPQDACKVSGNWFPKHANAKTAVRGAKNTHVEDNAYGADSPTVK
jgi:hypothetical protein